MDGKATFIQGALLGEEVIFETTRSKSDFSEGFVLEVISASADRVEPRCPHYILCGGCNMQHLDEKAQIIQKQRILLELLQKMGRTQPQDILEPLSADHWHYRNKARLSVRFVEKKQAVLIGFREKRNSRYITEIDQCPILNAQVDAQIKSLRSLIQTFDSPHAISQIEVAAGDEAVALIFRNLSALSASDEASLKEFAQSTGFIIYLQPGGLDTVTRFYPEDAPEFLHYSLPAHNIRFQFHPTDFTQVNSKINRLMIDKVLELMVLNANDIVLDLFCGLGNFSLPMARYCAQVIGVEGSDTMVARATMNADNNGIHNTSFYCANLEKDDALDFLKKQKITKLLIDPPRSGALAIMGQIATLDPESIVYVSCNPATLARDTEILVHQHGYTLVAAGVMDMFPHTAHVESIALFKKG